MSATAATTATSPYGELTSPTTLRLQRTLPGPIERVWAYLTDSELRRQWLAAGAMQLAPGTSFELVWRNDELSLSASERPAGFAEEARATCQLSEIEPLRKLGFSWPGVGEVSFELEPLGDEVVLTVTHSRLPNRGTAVLVGAGWHMHCDILSARLAGVKPASFWIGLARLRQDYEGRIPA